MINIVAIAGKTVSDAATATEFPPNPNSQTSTINTVAREVKEAGGDAIPVQVDVRSFENVQDMVDRVIKVSASLRLQDQHCLRLLDATFTAERARY